ncbi:MAG: biotin--[acetyl-CoA-carboxylase] ligase [bacterium]|nr:biotin--[acetyl-CoA-carboxylase] ligase [bacterium]
MEEPKEARPHLFKKIYSYETLASTNETAKELLQNNEMPDYFIIVANEQTKGKGRWGRYWWSPKGGLWCSIVTPKNLPDGSQISIPSLRTAFSIVETIKKFSPLTTGIRWPNDILIRGKKIGGILTESEGEKLVIGVGVNLNQVNFPKELPDATSLRIELGSQIDNEEFLNEFIINFENNIEREDILNLIKSRLLLLGERVIIKVKGDEILGEFCDIECDGSLLLREATGIISKLTPSEVEFIR